MGLDSELKLDLKRVGDASVVFAHGEIDLATFAEAEAALDGARGVEVLVLDLRGVEFMDTSGLRLVVHERQRAEVDGYTFVVVRGPAKVQRLFEIAGFPPGDGLFVNAPTEVPSGGGV